MVYNYKRSNIHWGTPEWLKKRFSGDDWWDPCPAFSETDALKTEWPNKNIFLNPPFDGMSHFGKKFYAEYLRHKGSPRRMVFLLPADRLNRKYLQPMLNECSLTLINQTVHFTPLQGQKEHKNGFHLPVFLLELGNEKGKFTLINQKQPSF